MICIIRIKGEVGLRRETIEGLNRMRLKRKYACVVVKSNPDNIGVVKKLKDFVAYGKIDAKTFEKLIERRGQLLDKSKKIDAKKIAKEITEGKSFAEAGLKPFFRLHPPRGGIDSKIHFGKKKGVLGNNGEAINKLVERML